MNALMKLFRPPEAPAATTVVMTEAQIKAAALEAARTTAMQVERELAKSYEAAIRQALSEQE